VSLPVLPAVFVSTESAGAVARRRRAPCPPDWPPARTS